MIPVHGAAWDDERNAFPAMKRLTDGEALVL
jgi:hypothetical protein